MRRRRPALLLCLVVCSLAAHAAAPRAAAQTVENAQAPAPRVIDSNALRVDEPATRAALDGGQVRLTLAVVNPSRRTIPARVSLELLDPQDNVVARDERTATLRPGPNRVAASLALGVVGANPRGGVLWHRVRYRVAPDSTAAPNSTAPRASTVSRDTAAVRAPASARDSAAVRSASAAAVRGASVAPTFAAASSVAAAEGVVALSEITPDLFELRVAAPQIAREGHPYRVRARTVHPVTSRPVAGVRVTARMEFDDDRQPALSASAATGRDGYATIDFRLPASVSDDEIDLEVKARRGGFEQTASDDFELERTLSFLITTDKPLYQPGQTLRVRAIALDPARRPAPGVGAALIVKDEDDTVAFRAQVETSRFGVLSAEWPIPESSRLGEYTVKIEVEEGKYEDSEGLARVRISRYELPNFTVQPKPDRPYYLPGEAASIEVRAEYLFGQPVKRGRVRVVRESRREWNFAAQKYDLEEGASYEGEFDSEGRFVARVDLAPDFKELAEDSWRRFRDLGFAAYVTDPTTNRTEQRRFSLRLSREPVHVYVTEANRAQAEGLPLSFFVSTYYPDGTPAECEVRMSEIVTRTVRREGLPDHTETREGPPRAVRTNGYGVAEVSGPTPARGEEKRESVTLRFEARDREGRAGRHDEDFWLRHDAPVVRVETDKAIYSAGEPVEVSLVSDKPDLKLILDVVSDGRVLHTEAVRLRGGRARTSVPYRPEFRNVVALTAYAAEFPESDYDDFARGTRNVIFPRDRELKFDLRFARATYEPGEEASADLRVRTSSGRAAETALGVVVFDKAVEERARTDQESNAAYGFSDYFQHFWYGPESVGGVTLRDLERLDPAKPRPAGLDTVADLLLQRDGSHYSPNFFGGEDYEGSQREVFARLAARQLGAALGALKARYERTGESASDEPALRRMLDAAGIALEDLRDPWGTPYRPRFAVERQLQVIYFESAGADKKFGTGDDWAAGRSAWNYFTRTGEALTRAAEDYQRRSGLYLRDTDSLKRELRRAGLDFDALRDPWGRPYELRFQVSGTIYVFSVWSLGPDGQPNPPDRSWAGDDFPVWSIHTDYFARARSRADAAVAAFYKSRARLPRDEAELFAALRAAGAEDDELRDGWGRPYFAAFVEDSRYADSAATRAGESVARTEIVPVTQRLSKVRLLSEGADGRRGTADDFLAAEFSAVVSQQSAADAAPQTAAPVTTFLGGTGAIGGAVTDPQGAAVPGAQVTAKHQSTEQEFSAATDDEGRFTLRNLPSGLYTVRVAASGFRLSVIEGVQVRSASLAQLDIQVQLGGVQESVAVMADSSESTENAYAASASERLKSAPASPASRRPVTTPRLRKDFPETLYWQPELLTDARGRAQLKFKLADNITTWRVSVIASTESGELGAVERELRAFQPFFVEHDPPPVLTEGDEISLPVVLRNYLERTQRVALDIKPEDWFALTGPARKTADVPAGDAARETFDIRAVASVAAGRQRITAVGADASDAVEKPVHVHPDGEEIAHTATQMLEQSAAILIDIPASAVPRSARAELKVYPNLLSHAVESVEAVMSRPYGCGEQTISSSYPSLLVLRHYTRLRGGDARLPATAAQARRYLRLGYERLLSYRTPEGGFSYWGRDEPDLALTAYALRFLTDAAEFVAVDEGVTASARRWLVSQQQEDGSWPARHWNNAPDPRRTALLTAYVARTLAALEKPSGARERQFDASTQTNNPTTQTSNASTQTNNPATQTSNATAQTNNATTQTNNSTTQTPDASPSQPTAEQRVSQTSTTPQQPAPGGARNAAPSAPLPRAFRYLAARSEEIDEPYLIASYALAAIDGGAPRAEIERLVAKLRSLARDERNGSYWALETNTPFYGWGLAGRIETTALAVQALASYCGLRIADCGLESGSGDLKSETSDSKLSDPQSAIRNPQLVSRGLLFLLRSKDRYGVWLSTQATVNVLDALLLLSREPGATRARPAPGGDRAEVFVNGQPAGTLALPSDERADAPLLLDLSRHLAPGANRVEIKRAAGAPVAAAQLVTTYYLPWSASDADGREQRLGSSRALRLAVSFDRTRGATGDEIVCRVEAERIGHSGYGMLLAEVGLPPGADVDRASLERAMKESGWEFSRYDVLPDRLVVYLWPRAGGTRFQFAFRPRLGLNAKSAPSQLYDYYNPEARAVLPPDRFVFTDAAKPRPTQARRE